MRAELAVREAFVRTRARYIVLLKALLRRDGLRIASGPSGRILERLAGILYAMWRDGTVYGRRKAVRPRARACAA